VCVKESNIFIGLKKTCLGVLDKRERNKDKKTCLGVLDKRKRGKDNATGLKEGGIMEMLTTVLHSRAAPSLKYLPSNV